MLGIKFRRQQVVDGFRVDFYSAEHRLAIEIDGGVHDEPGQHEYDALRTEHLNHLGIRVVRVANRDVNRATFERLLSPLSLQGEGGRGGEVPQ